jgi:hypothetical protein
VGDPLPRRADRTTAAAAITARGRRFSLGPSVITSARAGEPLRAEAHPIQDEIMFLRWWSQPTKGIKGPFKSDEIATARGSILSEWYHVGKVRLTSYIE